MSRRWQPAIAHLTWTFLGILPNFTTTAQRQLKEGARHARRVFSVNLYLGCGVGKYLHPSSPGQRLAHRKGPLNAENAVRTTGLLTTGRDPGDRTGPACRTGARPAPRPTRAVRYSAMSTGAADSQGTPTSSALAKRWASGHPARKWLLSDIFNDSISACFRLVFQHCPCATSDTVENSMTADGAAPSPAPAQGAAPTRTVTQRRAAPLRPAAPVIG